MIDPELRKLDMKKSTTNVQGRVNRDMSKNKVQKPKQYSKPRPISGTSKLKVKTQPAKPFSKLPPMLAPKPQALEGGYTQWGKQSIFPGNQPIVTPNAYTSMDDARKYLVDTNGSATVGLYNNSYSDSPYAAGKSPP